MAFVPLIVPVRAGLGRCRLDLVVDGKQLGRLAEVVAGAERGEVGVAAGGLPENFDSIQSTVTLVGRP